MRPVIRAWLFAVVVAVGMGTPTHAPGYVRTRTKVTCRPLRWAQTCIFLQSDAELARDDMPADAVEHAIQGAISSWNDRLPPSSFLRIYYLPKTDSREASQTDRLGWLKFRFERWCRPAKDANSSPLCFDPSATAVTTVSFFNKPNEPDLDGQIVDTDIDLNTVGFRFVDGTQPLPTSDRRSPVDLWNVLTHELGHVQGLDHTCNLNSGASPDCQTDHTGAAVLSCSDLDAKRLSSQNAETAYEAAMYPSSVAGEYSRRTPTADDLSGVIAAHPASADPQICTWPAVAKGCAIASTAPAPLPRPYLWTLLLTLCLPLGLLMRARSRKQRLS